MRVSHFFAWLFLQRIMLSLLDYLLRHVYTTKLSAQTNQYIAAYNKNIRRLLIYGAGFVCTFVSVLQYTWEGIYAYRIQQAKHILHINKQANKKRPPSSPLL